MGEVGAFHHLANRAAYLSFSQKKAARVCANDKNNQSSHERTIWRGCFGKHAPFNRMPPSLSQNRLILSGGELWRRLRRRFFFATLLRTDESAGKVRVELAMLDLLVRNGTETKQKNSKTPCVLNSSVSNHVRIPIGRSLRGGNRVKPYKLRTSLVGKPKREERFCNTRTENLENAATI